MYYTFVSFEGGFKTSTKKKLQLNRRLKNICSFLYWRKSSKLTYLWGANVCEPLGLSVYLNRKLQPSVSIYGRIIRCNCRRSCLTGGVRGSPLPAQGWEGPGLEWLGVNMWLMISNSRLTKLQLLQSLGHVFIWHLTLWLQLVTKIPAQLWLRATYKNYVKGPKGSSWKEVKAAV